MSDATSFLACHLDKCSLQHISFCFCNENGAENKKNEESEPPACQLRSASRPIKCKVATVPRQSTSSSKPTKRGKEILRWASQATSSPGDDNQDKGHSPGEPSIEAHVLHLLGGILQDLDLTPQKHGHRRPC
ncbi:hypothetical protein AMECASPLE_000891 [Ameca splendens]|uniref:Uncharacterized protein n=1 Tax=Ameca splendens TaxID=208324 RepID=A0ABV0ZTT1_9TELE